LRDVEDVVPYEECFPSALVVIALALIINQIRLRKTTFVGGDVLDAPPPWGIYFAALPKESLKVSFAANNGGFGYFGR